MSKFRFSYVLIYLLVLFFNGVQSRFEMFLLYTRIKNSFTSIKLITDQTMNHSEVLRSFHQVFSYCELTKFRTFHLLPIPEVFGGKPFSRLPAIQLPPGEFAYVSLAGSQANSIHACIMTSVVFPFFERNELILLICRYS